MARKKQLVWRERGKKEKIKSPHLPSVLGKALAEALAQSQPNVHDSACVRGDGTHLSSLFALVTVGRKNKGTGLSRWLSAAR